MEKNDNSSLGRAKKQKKDEFYTRFEDVGARRQASAPLRSHRDPEAGMKTKMCSMTIAFMLAMANAALAYSPIIVGALADVRIKVIDDMGEAVPDATNEVGEVVHANYGRIGKKSGHMFGLRMKAWFNTTDNDTNLEDARLI